MRIWGVAAVASLGLAVPCAAADPEALFGLLETGDTTAITDFVTAYYRDAGISTNESLTWQLQSFDQIVNWYNDFTESILLAELPAPAQVPAYWQNWSEVLTGGAWDWRAFFATPDEAALMANFNQFMLAAHEYGHALTYRFDPGHDGRWGQAVNCREFAADRLASALLDEIASSDARIAALRARYVALMTQLNAGIAPAERHAPVTLAALEQDCRILDVVQPTAETMTPYASAYFVRHIVLDAADLPPLAEIYATHLLPHWRERQITASGRGGAVTTGAPLALDLDVAETTLEVEQRVPAFAPDGSLWVLEYGFDGTDRLDARFGLGPAGGPVEEILPLQRVPGVRTTGDLIYVGSAAVIGPGHVVALQNGFGLEGDEGLLFDLRRGTDGAWVLRTLNVADPEGYYDLWVAPDAGGAIQVFVGLVGSSQPDLRRLTIDPDTLTVTATAEFPRNFGTAVAVGPDGTVYWSDENRITVVGADGVPRALAGNGLQGFKDAADPLAAEFMTSDHGVALADRLIVLDRDPIAHAWVLRTIAFAR